MSNLIELSGQIPAALAGLRIDQAAAEMFPDYSRARLQSWIREGSLTIEGQTARPKQKVAGGERLQLKASPEPCSEDLPEAIPLDIVFEDPDIILINKPAGLVVHPAAGHRSGTLLNALLHFDPKLSEIPRAGIVHRLDKDTSGILVIARSLRAHTGLTRQLQLRTMSRVYHSVVSGRISKAGRVDAPIGRDPRNRQRMAVVPSGRKAVTHYDILKQYEAFTYLRVSLETGRTHQIRVHMQHLGFPMAGDPLYGPGRNVLRRWPEEIADAIASFGRQALHAKKLKLEHPASGETLTFSTPLPADFQQLINTLDEC